MFLIYSYATYFKRHFRVILSFCSRGPPLRALLSEHGCSAESTCVAGFRGCCFCAPVMGEKRTQRGKSQAHPEIYIATCTVLVTWWHRSTSQRPRKLPGKLPHGARLPRLSVSRFIDNFLARRTKLSCHLDSLR